MELEAELAGIIENGAWLGESSIAVTDLQTGETISVGGQRAHYSGCVMNLFVILAVLRDVHDGLIPLGDVEALIRETIRTSNAGTGQALYEIVGGGSTLEGVKKVAALIDYLGLSGDVVLDHPPMFPQWSLGVDLDNWVTAEAMNRFFQLIHNGGVLAEPERSFLYDALLGVKPGLNYLMATISSEALVGHKNGWFPSNDGEWYVDNDAAIVRYPCASGECAYAITFLSQFGPWEYSTAEVAWALADATWEAMRAAYP